MSVVSTRTLWSAPATTLLRLGLFVLVLLLACTSNAPTQARFNFRKSPELLDDFVPEGSYQAFLFIKQLKVGGSTVAGIVRQFMQLKWGTSCIEPMRREFTLSGKDG